MKAAVALSGGVDSAVAAYECIRRGYECIGFTLLLPGGDTSGAEMIARQLNIPLHVCDVQEAFTQHVVEPFVQGYICGETPNPCVPCNKKIKFDACMQFENILNTPVIATGHYAKIKNDNGRYFIQKASDENKDQSYYLYGLTQEQLKNTIFPLGELTKPEVRDIARKQGFMNAEKAESQDICFIPDGDYVSFITHYLNKKAASPLLMSDINVSGNCDAVSYKHKEPVPGDFTDMDGNIIGQHKGHIHYTIGQRKGLGIAWHSPLFVKEKNIETNTVVLCGSDDLFSDTLDAIQCNWSIPIPAEPFRVKARIRYRQKEQWATVSPTSPATVQVVFDEPQRAIAKGQHVVMYDGSRVIGGGVIA